MKPSGRAASALIVARLRAALLRGVPLTYEELAIEANCTERSVRSYLKDAHATLGLRVQREPGQGRTIRVRIRTSGASTTIEQLANGLAHEMLQRIFPVEGTDLERRPSESSAQLVVSVRGAYMYEDEHLRALRRWLQAAASSPKRRVRFAYGDRDGRPRLVWPIGMVVRDLARVYLAGVPDDAAEGAEVRTYALERLRRGEPIVYADSKSPPAGLDVARVADAIDDPFSVFPATHDAAMVHVRFKREERKYVEHRLWHRTQVWKPQRDGSIDLRFGPADLHETAAWVRQWGQGVCVLGDDRLLEALAVNDAPSKQSRTSPRRGTTTSLPPRAR